MKNLDGVIQKIGVEISEKEKVREEALRFSREIVICSRRAIQHLHRGLVPEAEGFITQAGSLLAKLRSVTAPHLDIFYTGYVENAEQEYVEASCLLAIMQGRDLPGPESLQTTSSSYLLGLCDVVGELRRAALDFMLAGEVKKATAYLRLMDQIYDAVMGFDYPSGLVPIKKKQDVIRSLLEKTRGELVVVSSEQRMGERSRPMLGAKTGSKAGIRRRSSSGEDEDLDVDKVW